MASVRSGGSSPATPNLGQAVLPQTRERFVEGQGASNRVRTPMGPRAMAPARKFDLDIRFGRTSG